MPPFKTTVRVAHKECPPSQRRRVTVTVVRSGAALRVQRTAALLAGARRRGGGGGAKKGDQSTVTFVDVARDCLIRQYGIRTLAMKQLKMLVQTALRDDNLARAPRLRCFGQVVGREDDGWRETGRKKGRLAGERRISRLLLASARSSVERKMAWNRQKGLSPLRRLRPGRSRR